MALICCAVLIAQSSLSLAQTIAESPTAESFDDVLLVANSSFFARNIDGSLRLPEARDTPVMTISDCLLRDTTSTSGAWIASSADRKRRKVLEPYRDVPAYYRQRAVSDVVALVQPLVSSSLSSSLGFQGRVEFSCDEYRLEQGGVGTIVFVNKLFLVPAFLAESALYELERTTPSRQQERYDKSRYLIIKRFTLSELQAPDRLAEAARQEARDRLAEYQQEVSADRQQRVGMVSRGRNELNPTVCVIAGDRQRADAEIVYAEEFVGRNYAAQMAKIASERRFPPQVIEALRSERRKPISIKEEKYLNDVYIGMTSRRSCGLFVGSPKDVMELLGALVRDTKRDYPLGELRRETELLETYATQRGYGSYTEVSFARAIGVSREQLQPLLARGIRDQVTYAALLDEMLAEGYSTARDFKQLLAYLSDREAGAKRGSNAVVERDRRLAASLAASQEAEARRRLEQQAFDSEYPYEAVISCGAQQRHLSLMPCFLGASTGLNTQLELRTPDQYGMYQATGLFKLGREIPGEGLKVSLKSPFSLRAQNADKNLLLTIRVIEKASGRVLFIKSAAQFEAIVVGF